MAVRRVLRPPSLRRLWVTTTLNLIGVVVVLGALAVAGVTYVSSSFSARTDRVQRELEALSTIDVALLDVTDPAGQVMYGFGDPGASLSTYNATAAGVYAGFEAAEAAMVSRPALERLARARAQWEEADRVILAAPARVASGEVGEALANGEDPFRESMWVPYGGATVDVSNLQHRAVAELHSGTVEMVRIQRIVVAAVAVAVAVAVGVALLAARRIARRVVDPLLRLRHRAVAMQELDGDAVINVEGSTSELVDLAASITETATYLRAAHGRLRAQAYTDALTGVANRKAFQNWLDARLAMVPTEPVTIAFLDLDDFKDVNDTLGHEAGDVFLQEVASRLVEETRGDDIVARLGGDEFAVGLAGVPVDRAVHAAQRLLDALRRPVSHGGRSIPVSCSIGMASAKPGDEEADLLRQADIAMYHAKGCGKNRVQVYADSMGEAVAAGIALKRELADAVRLDQLQLHYQPIVDLDTGSVLGLEALVRWNHPTKGLLLPGVFIPLAEQTGDIADIGAWVLDRACRDVAAATEGGVSWVSVNVSASQIAHPGFAEGVRQALETHGIAPNRLMLEVTEAVALADLAGATAVLATVRELGVQIALDDFGTGFSSLQYLRALPIDVIKVDRCFIGDTSGDSLLEAIIHLGRSFGLDVIVEGIERTEELDRVRALGSLAGQGYLFARPAGFDEARCAALDIAVET